MTRALVGLVSSLFALLLLLTSGVEAQPPFQPPMGPFARGGSPWGSGSTLDWITPLALIIAAVFFVLWIVERRKGDAPNAGTGTSALDILKARYARGEIDRQEFQEKWRDLL